MGDAGQCPCDAGASYGALSVVHAGAAVPLLLFPDATARFLLALPAAPGPERTRLLGLLAGCLLAGSSGACFLRQTAKTSPALPHACWMKLGLAGMGAAAVAISRSHRGCLTGQGAAVWAALGALTCAGPLLSLCHDAACCRPTCPVGAQARAEAAVDAEDLPPPRTSLHAAARRLGSACSRCPGLSSLRNPFAGSTLYASNAGERGWSPRSLGYVTAGAALLLGGSWALFQPQRSLPRALGVRPRGPESELLWRMAAATAATLGPALALALHGHGPGAAEGANEARRRRRRWTLWGGAAALAGSHAAVLGLAVRDRSEVLGELVGPGCGPAAAWGVALGALAADGLLGDM